MQGLLTGMNKNTHLAKKMPNEYLKAVLSCIYSGRLRLPFNDEWVCKPSSVVDNNLSTPYVAIRL